MTAFYTPKLIIDVLSETLNETGIIPNRLLEPSAGLGSFIQSFNIVASEAQVGSFEKDLLTGKILSNLFPKDKVRIEGL